MKAILVKSCYECPYREYFDKGVICMQMGLTWTDKMDGYFPDWCPLRPMPHKLRADWYSEGYREGFNACLDEILGETE